MQTIVKVANSILAPLRISVEPVVERAPRHVSGDSLNEIASQLASFQRVEVIAEVPMNKGRGLPQFSWGADGTHPFVQAATAGLRHDSTDAARNAIRSSLADFYDSYQPRNLFEVFWPSGESPGKLSGYPAWSVMMPWQGGDDVHSWTQKVRETVQKEGRRGRRRLTVEDGWSWSGPVSSEKLDLEAQRLAKTLRGIERKGYRRHDGFDGDIRAILLIDSAGGWAWQSFAGQHRVAALSALDAETATVRFSGLVRKTDVQVWPQVVNGLYTPEQAVEIFVKILSA